MYQMELDQFEIESDKTKIEIPKSIHKDQDLEELENHNQKE